MNVALMGLLGFALIVPSSHAQVRPAPTWHLSATDAVMSDITPKLRETSLRLVQTSDLPSPSSAKASIRPYLLTGLVVGAAAGSIAVAVRSERRCHDCWLAPALEIPLFIGGGALLGYGAGGLVYAVVRMPARSTKSTAK